MKTLTYLRLSLLIPFAVWVICLLLFFVFGGLYELDVIKFGEPFSIPGMFVLLVMFYAVGIIVWIFPYLILSLLLLVWSFYSRAQTMLRVFALSPIAMAFLAISAANIWPLFTSGTDLYFRRPTFDSDNFIRFNSVIAAITLVWGYVCVGIGFGMYKLLQKQRFIRDEETVESASIPISQNE